MKVYDNIYPVSYTHLDVYKRQVITSVSMVIVEDHGLTAWVLISIIMMLAVKALEVVSYINLFLFNNLLRKLLVKFTFFKNWLVIEI